MAKADKKEYLDLVDEDDNVIGREERSVIYSQGLRNYRVVNIFIFNSKGEVLLPKRDATRRIFPNCYDFSCGEHVLAGETYEEAATRGLKEELGINNVNLVTIGKIKPKDGVSSFMKVFKVIYTGEISPKEGIQSIGFYSLQRIKEMIARNPKKFKDDLPRVINLLEKRF